MRSSLIPTNDIITLIDEEILIAYSIKMYRSRISKWGWDKNKSKKDMVFVLHKMRAREIEGKKTTFNIKGHVVTEEDVIRYFKKAGGLKKKAGTREVVTTPRGVTYRTPSPEPSWGDVEEEDEVPSPAFGFRNSRFHPPTEKHSNITTQSLENGSMLSYMPIDSVRQFFSSDPSLSPSISPPIRFQIPEIVLSSIDTYFSASIASGNWVTNAEGFCINIHSDDTASDTYNGDIYGARNLLDHKRYVEARRALSKASALIPRILRAEKPSTLNSFLYNTVCMINFGYPEVSMLLLQHISATASVILPDGHPWKLICEYLGKIERDQVEDAIFRFWEAAIDASARNLGRFHAMSTSYYVNYVSRRYSFDKAQEELLLKAYLEDCKRTCGDTSSNICRIMFSLADNLSEQKRWHDVENVTEELVARSRVADGQVYNVISGLETLAECQYHLNKPDQAEKSLREAIDLTVSEEGERDLNVVPNLTMLEEWLREWGREEEADKLKEELEGLIGTDDIDETFEAI